MFKTMDVDSSVQILFGLRTKEIDQKTAVQRVLVLLRSTQSIIESNFTNIDGGLSALNTPESYASVYFQIDQQLMSVVEIAAQLEDRPIARQIINEMRNQLGRIQSALEGMIRKYSKDHRLASDHTLLLELKAKIVKKIAIIDQLRQ